MHIYIILMEDNYKALLFPYHRFINNQLASRKLMFISKLNS